MTDAPAHITAARQQLGAKANLIEGLLEEIAPILKEQAQRINALEKRLAAVEAQTKEFCYKGVWKTDETYKVSNSVTDGGQIFIALRDSQGQRPGFSDHWRLAVRKGADGKDAR